jgi:hypothetical protein
VIVGLLILGVLLLGAEVIAVRVNRRTLSSGSFTSRWRWLYKWQLAVGLALAIGAAFISYPASGGSDQYKVWGVPFIAFAIDQRGWDYVGPLSALAFILNGVAWILFPAFVLWLWRLRQSLTQGTPNKSLERTRGIPPLLLTPS